MISLIEPTPLNKPLQWNRKRKTTFGHNLLVGLVEFWPLSEQLSVRRGVHGGRNLSDTNGVSGKNGVFSLASQFDRASTEDLQYPDDTSLEFGTGDFSISLWFNADTVTYGASAQGTILGKDYTAYEVLIYQGSLYGYCGGTANGVTISAVSTGTWYHAGIGRSGSTFQGYLNGVATGASATNSADTSTQSYAFKLGQRGRSTDITNCYNGGIQRVGIWNRALTADEWAALYRGGTSLNYPFI